MPRELVVGVDLGTTALKAAIFDSDGDLLAAADAAYEIERPKPEWAEQDAEGWMVALGDVLSQLAQVVPRTRAKAIGICSQVNTHVFVDKRYRPLRPAIVWQDQRCAGVAAELNQRLAAAAESSGVDSSSPHSFAPSTAPPRAEWIAREEPEVWKGTRYVLSPKDFVAAQLALPATPATDPITPFDLVDDLGVYDPTLVGVVDGLAERVPRIEPLDRVIGCVVGDRFPLIEDALVVTGTMDAWGSVYGSGVLEHGDAMEVGGTSEILGLFSRTRTPTAGVVSFLPVDGLYLHAGPTQAGGAALGWFANLVGLTIPEAIALAAEAPAGSDGLIFLPHLLGERAPIWDSELRGGFIGMSSEHELSHACRAVLEGVAYSARQLLEALEQAGEVTVQELRASGGGAQSDFWCQIKADVLDRPLARLRVRQSGCLGAALMAASGAGLVENLREASRTRVQIETTFDPGSERGRYDDLYRLYRGLYEALKPTHAALAALREQPQPVPTS